MLIGFSKRFSRKNLYELMEISIGEYCGPKQNIVSIGAGGDVKRILTKHGLTFKEIDVDTARRPDFVCSAEQMDIFENNSVDVFFCMEVLEHVKKPWNAIMEMERVLKPGGIIIGSTPFIFPIHEEPFDFYRYTKYGLLNLFENFEKIKLVERNSYLESVYVVLLRTLNIGSRKQRFVGALLFPIFLLILPFLFVLVPFVTNKQSTTGYFFIFKKSAK